MGTRTVRLDDETEKKHLAAGTLETFLSEARLRR